MISSYGCKWESDFNPQDWKRFKSGEMVMTNSLDNGVLVEKSTVDPSEILDYSKPHDLGKYYKYITYRVFEDKVNNIN